MQKERGVTSKGKAQKSQGKSDSKQAQEYSLKRLSTLFGHITSLKCRKCQASPMKQFDLKQHIKTWSQAALYGYSSNSRTAILSTISCNSCGAKICVGCSKNPCTTSATVVAAKYDIFWCCDLGRTISVWLVLCWADGQLQQQIENEYKVTRGKQHPNMKYYSPSDSIEHKYGHPTGGTSSEAHKKGTGYATGPLSMSSFSFAPPGDLNFPMEMDSMMWSATEMVAELDNTMASIQIKDADPQVDRRNEDVFRILTALLSNTNSKGASFDDNQAETISACFKFSTVLDVLATIVRNDSIDDAIKRKGLYFSALDLIERLAVHHTLVKLVTEPRPSRKKMLNLYMISADTSKVKNMLGDSRERELASVMSSLTSFGLQARMILSASTVMNKEFQDSDARNQLILCKHVDELLKKLPVPNNTISASTHKHVIFTPAMQNWTEYQKHHRVHVVDDKFVVPNIMVHRRWQGEYTQYPRAGRMRQLVKEVASMMTSLPEGIFLRVGESRPDCIRAAIIGPAGTPYFGGIFEFDIFCGMDYPQKPPSVMWRFYSDMVYMNTNLHPDGEVCLSLLGTHPGESTETWQPGVSTLYQLLVSIQTFIFKENPADDEPTRLPNGKMQAIHEKALLHQTQMGTVWGYILPWIRERQHDSFTQSLWSELVRKYFAANAEELLRTVKKWSQENRELRHTTYASNYGSTIVSSYLPVGVNLVAMLEKDLKTFLQTHSGN